MKEYKYLGKILGSLGVFLFVMMLFSLSDPTFFLDRWGENLSGFFQNSLVKQFLIVVSQLMSFPVIFLFGVLLFFVFFFKRRKMAMQVLFFYTATISFGSLIVQAIKFLLQRSRPLEPLLEFTGYSFPSGHSFSAMVIYGFFIVMIHHFSKNTYWKLFGYFLFGALILITGYSRIYLHAHYLTDVVAGYSLGIFALTVMNHFFKKERRKQDEKELG